MKNINYDIKENKLDEKIMIINKKSFGLNNEQQLYSLIILIERKRIRRKK